jgi:hypothetical protein
LVNWWALGYAAAIIAINYFSRSVRVITVKTWPSYRYQFGVRCGVPFRLIVATTAM